MNTKLNLTSTFNDGSLKMFVNHLLLVSKYMYNIFSKGGNTLCSFYR